MSRQEGRVRGEGGRENIDICVSFIRLRATIHLGRATFVANYFYDDDDDGHNSVVPSPPYTHTVSKVSIRV